MKNAGILFYFVILTPKSKIDQILHEILPGAGRSQSCKKEPSGEKANSIALVRMGKHSTFSNLSLKAYTSTLKYAIRKIQRN